MNVGRKLTRSEIMRMSGPRGVRLRAQLEHAGQWSAWTRDHSQIKAVAPTFQEVWDATRGDEEADVVFEKLPRLDASFVGSP